MQPPIVSPRHELETQPHMENTSAGTFIETNILPPVPSYSPQEHSKQTTNSESKMTVEQPSTLRRLGTSALTLTPGAREYGSHSLAHAPLPATQLIAKAHEEATAGRTETHYRRIRTDDMLKAAALPSGAPIKWSLLTHGQESGINPAFLEPGDKYPTAQLPAVPAAHSTSRSS